MLWTNDDKFNLPFELKISDCPSNQTLLKINTRDGINKIEITSECSKAFSRNDRKLSCNFEYSNKDSTRNNIDSIDIKLNVEYGPFYDESYKGNITAIEGMNTKLICPIRGNPIHYYWYLIESSVRRDLNCSSQEYSLPTTLSVDKKYTYSCHAKISNIETQQMDFEVYVTHDKDQIIGN